MRERAAHHTGECVTRSRRAGTTLIPLVLPLAFLGVALSHITLLHLPYFWDEGGYYIPAALDFYRTGTLIPQFTNAHPPLPNIVLGLLWHTFGVHILVTRLTACAFAATGLTAIFALSQRLVGSVAATGVAFLTAIYPIWFAQSSLAHADIFAAAFTLASLALFLSSPELIGNNPEIFSTNRRLAWGSVCFCLAVLSKETAIVQPAALAVAEMVLAYRYRTQPTTARAHWRWTASLSVPVPILALWFGYHYLRTGQVFGNSVYLRYNATENFTIAHTLYAFRIRCVHVFWQREMWLPLTLALACLLLLPRRSGIASLRTVCGLPSGVAASIGVIVCANLLAFSLLGGALLTRYLLPVYPLLLLTAVAIWRERSPFWPLLAGLTAVAFLSALWLNPFTFFAPEDNLTYRDMIVVQQDAIRFLDQHFPGATVLTAWPAAAELTRPALGYTTHIFRIVSVENFTAMELGKAAQEPGRYDTALVFTTHYTSPAFRRFLLSKPRSWRGRRYTAGLDLSADEIAKFLGGTVVWQEDRYGEWAAVLRFARSYEALTPAHEIKTGTGAGKAFPYTSASSPPP